MIDFTHLRSRRGKRVHLALSDQLRKVLCGPSADGWTLTEDAPSCEKCKSIALEMLI